MRNPFAPRRRFVTDELPWQAILSHRGRRRVVYTDDGGWMMTIAFRGPDMDCRSLEDRFRLMSRFNNAFRRLGTNFAAWVEEQHIPIAEYPEVTTPHPAARLFETERAWLFREAGQHFTTRCFLSVLYRPPVAALNRLTRMMIDFDPEDTKNPYAHELDQFVTVVERLCGLLTFMPRAVILEGGELLEYLHSTISTKLQPVADIDWDEQLPGALVDQPFTGGMRPALGHPHERHDLFAISVHNYPRWMEGGLLRALRDLPVRWRRVSRWFPQNRHESDKEIQRAWSKAAVARKPLGVQVMETVSGPVGSRIDPTADQTMIEAEEAQVELAEGLVTRGYLTNSLIVMVPEGGGGLQQAKEVERILLNAGLICEIESFNATEVILGSIPGNLYHDVTRHGVNSAAASCIFPLDAPWLGSPVNPHLGGPALMQVTRGGCSPFHLNLHVGDVGHFLTTGWTGAGKSTKLNAFRLAHRARHPQGQVFSLDKGRSSKVLTLALGGRFVDFGATAGEGVAVQPLRFLEDVRDRTWAYAWIMAILKAADPERAKDPELENEVSAALASFRDTVPPDLRTLTTFQATVQDFWIKQVLRPYTRFGDFGHIFDGVDARAWDNDVVTFEIGDVLNQPMVLSPLVDFLFHLAERRADPERPMLFIADEAWAYMRPPFSDRLETAIREMRRNNVQIGFATQSIHDAVNSPASHVILSNCPTRFYLPDPDALQPQSVDILEGLGLRMSEIEALAHAVPKRQYMVQQKVFDPTTGGIAIFDMTLGPVGLALCAATSLAAQQRAERVRLRWGDQDFLYGWLLENGLEAAADAVGQRLLPDAAE